MRIEINKKIGQSDYRFEVTDENDFNCLFKAGFVGSMPSKCSCGSEDISLASNKAQEYLFVKLVCNTCKMQSQVGQFKDGAGLFWKPWEKYEKVSK